jgi:hypothetical protein
MGQPRRTQSELDDPLLAEYQALQLTPEQKESARADLAKKIEAARRDGVYERAREIAGTVEWSLSWQELRGKE